MKKLGFVCLLCFLSAAVYSQNWTVDGNVDFVFYHWSGGSYSDGDSRLLLTLTGGKYVSDKFNVGLRVGGALGYSGTNFSLGPALRYDFFEFDRVSFALTGAVYYTRYFESYRWNDYYAENDANIITVSVAPRVSYRINKNVEAYWQFFSVGYKYLWLTLRNTDIKCVMGDFNVALPQSDHVLGLTFRF